MFDLFLIWAKINLTKQYLSLLTKFDVFETGMTVVSDELSDISNCSSPLSSGFRGNCSNVVSPALKLLTSASISD